MTRKLRRAVALLLLAALMLGCVSTEPEAVDLPENTTSAPAAQTDVEAHIAVVREQTEQPTPQATAVPEPETPLPTETPQATAVPEPQTPLPTATPEPESNGRITDDSSFEIYYLDVGQGDAACVICDGRAMLIDGGSSANSRLIYSFLKSHGIDHLDVIIATHADADHVGGLSGALQIATVGTAYCSVRQSDTEAFQDFLKYLNRRNTEITVPSAGDRFSLGSATAVILYPQSGLSFSDNSSVAVRIEYGETSFLFTGDCESEDETAMLSGGLELSSTVLKVAHHGSADATSSRFLQKVRPQYAVISVGGENTYGHPTDTVLAALFEAGVVLYRTDMHGTIRCVSDGVTVTFDTEKEPEFDPYLVAGGYAAFLARQSGASDRSASDDEAPVRYVVNKNTKKFHLPSCPSVNDIKESNKWLFTGTREELIEMGYVPCKRCHP